jgi:hypothetical protein
MPSKSSSFSGNSVSSGDQALSAILDLMVKKHTLSDLRKPEGLKNLLKFRAKKTL